ncbi:hypothetical protein RCL1_008165 [Eukaryota sp. TZLM3-RCL]
MSFLDITASNFDDLCTSVFTRVFCSRNGLMVAHSTPGTTVLWRCERGGCYRSHKKDENNNEVEEAEGAPIPVAAVVGKTRKAGCPFEIRATFTEGVWKEWRPMKHIITPLTNLLVPVALLEDSGYRGI